MPCSAPVGSTQYWFGPEVRDNSAMELIISSSAYLILIGGILTYLRLRENKHPSPEAIEELVES
jgi:hypothetical protein